MFRRRPDEVEPFSRVEIATPGNRDWGGMNLSVNVYSGDNCGEILRYAEAIVDGLKNGGFEATLTLTRETRESLR